MMVPMTTATIKVIRLKASFRKGCFWKKCGRCGWSMGINYILSKVLFGIIVDTV